MPSFPPASHALPVGYEPLRHAVAWADLGRRTTLLVTGADAVRFVDNFTTAAVSRVARGQGTEGFFTDARGWVLALANILRTDDGLWIDADAGLPVSLHAHLDRYHIREQLEIVDAADATAHLLVAGPQSSAWLAGACDRPPPAGLLDHVAAAIGGIPAAIVRIGWAGPEGFLVRVAAEDRPRLTARLHSAGIVEASREAVEVARIEEGWPAPLDIPEKTLPQELGRDDRAISFTKGCYLGQETVARIDALGHVNRRLVAIATDAPMSAGAEVRAGGEAIGGITSCCRSPRAGCWLGLGIVHAKGLGPGAALEVNAAAARVIPVPVVSEAGADSSAPSVRGGEVVFEAKRFRIVRIAEAGAAPQSGGSPRTREVVEHPGSVVVVPMVSAEEVCLVEVVRVAVGQTLLELPAGTLDRIESLAEAAGRELAEETGYRAGRIEPVAEFWMSPGILRERMHLFVAENLVPGPQALEPGEQIKTRVVPWHEAIAMCLDGRIDDAKTVAGLLLFDARHRHR